MSRILVTWIRWVGVAWFLIGIVTGIALTFASEELQERYRLEQTLSVPLGGIAYLLAKADEERNQR